MSIDWHPLRQELALWRAGGLALPVWWRDDDAVEPTSALDKLLEMGASLGMPVHVAVIPEPAQTALATYAEQAAFIPLVHGWTHKNTAPAGHKKAEFGHPRADALNETQIALARLRALFGTALVDMFVPPWNRIDAGVVRGLAAQGYSAVSTYTPRPARQVAGLVQINCHVDPINWKAGGGLVPADRVIAGLVDTLRARRTGHTDDTEPLGFLTHHLVHDDAIWAFTQSCLSELLDGGAAPINLHELKDKLP